MASPIHPQPRRASVCLTCGDEGDTKLLIYCRNCWDCAVHHYCLDKFSLDDDNINWWCCDCRENNIINTEPLRKSERIIIKRQKCLDIRKHWKQKLNRKKKLVQTSDNIHETGELANDGHLTIKDLETNSVKEMPRDLNIPEREKSIPKLVSTSEHIESINVDEPSFATNSNPNEQEYNVKSFDEIQEVPEFGNNEKIVLLKDRGNAQNDDKVIDHQVSCLVANSHPSTSDALCRQPYLEPDDSLSVGPTIAPIWRGWFNIKENGGTCVEILAHLSNKACFKVFNAAAAMPHVLDIELLDKHAALPNRFRDAPPTASSIGLYLFPACERDERVYDSLLDELIEGDQALKVRIHNVELLMFPSSVLPLHSWRLNSKYFLWGLFKKMQRSDSSTQSPTSRQRDSSTQLLGFSEPTAIGNKDADHLSPPSLKSTQASNGLPSMQNTPGSRSLELSKLDKTVGIDNWLAQEQGSE